MSKKITEYSRSPAPFVSIVILSLVFVVLALITYPDLTAFVCGLLAVLSMFPLPATLAINKEWEEAIILRFGKF